MTDTLKLGYFVKMYPRISETFIVNEILELERRGVEISIFSLKKPDEGRFHPQVSQVKANVYYLDSRQNKTGWPLIREHWPFLEPCKARLWELVEEVMMQGSDRQLELLFASASASATALELGLDHLHAHFASTPSTAAYYASRISGLGFSFTAHAKGIFRDTIDIEQLRSKASAARFVATVTHYNKRHMLSILPSIQPENIKVVYNGIDLDLFRYAAMSHREAGLILSVGRLVPKKGFCDLVAACSILKKQGVSFKCVIVGDGEQRRQIESLIRELGLEDQITLVGSMNQADVREYLNKASVFALPCIADADGNQDALPTVLLEAQAAGCPIVSTNLSGVPEIVDHNKNGLLVSPGNADELAEAIKEVLGNRELAQKLAIEGRRKAESTFDVKKNVAVLEQHFRAAISESEAPGGTDAKRLMEDMSNSEVSLSIVR